MRVPTLMTLAAVAAVGFSSPMPQEGGPNETDLCLQRKFLSALLCTDIDPTYTSVIDQSIV
ncbi:hypothetical protein Hte_002347 [Hypoxylon texense]